jgi:tetratricopeptide (TPR) repeat protein
LPLKGKLAKNFTEQPRTVFVEFLLALLLLSAHAPSAAAQTDSFEIAGALMTRSGIACGLCLVQLQDIWGKVRTTVTDNDYEEVTQLVTADSMSTRVFGLLDEAEREFLAATRLNPSNPAPLIHLAELYILRNDLESAAKASLDAIRLDPRSPAAFFNLGLALYCSSILDLAQDALKKALSLEPRTYRARALLIDIHLRLNERDRAMQLMTSSHRCVCGAGGFPPDRSSSVRSD